MTGYVLLVLVSLLTCAGQLCQKQAAESWRVWPGTKKVLRWLAAALVLLASAMVLWLAVLQRLPISIAYPLLSLNFVLITLCAKWFFGETTTWRHWAGVGTIISGILLMCWPD
ncbi:4-amino-4-deoxy-L-arabinose-phosphoundecaprenol flippase subunit ArnE [Biostraticola tofi]|uniref:Probable 4-amino-4-deoxy-L-arabinose-phosphoundecaprenol flippase subunit ArnE n=1 Tax=Biostraticola tofi TaxID=466109 RepID=A0A4R3Z1P3_9GAMM|nr:4-amino-4-deoxy-L-arabinose-phosphoundecaprenol flippase subunit ArnE [Biostraticola tofi]TCV98921.1 undecaprenyl phosphate-alpha-L-ara4N flippase subunit ArnE [Biostraticola tofi]